MCRSWLLMIYSPEETSFVAVAEQGLGWALYTVLSCDGDHLLTGPSVTHKKKKTKSEYRRVYQLQLLWVQPICKIQQTILIAQATNHLIWKMPWYSHLRIHIYVSNILGYSLFSDRRQDGVFEAFSTTIVFTSPSGDSCILFASTPIDITGYTIKM